MLREQEMGKRGHIPIRMCVGCRVRRRKGELIRLPLDPEGISSAKGKTGRSVYLCPDIECLRLAKKRNRLGRLAESFGELNTLETFLIEKGK